MWLNPARSLRPLALAVLCLSTPLAAGCGEDPEPEGSGELSLSWRVLPTGCEGAGVEAIRVVLASQVHGTITESFACQALSATMREVPSGRYYASVSGLDASGRAIFKAPDHGEVVVRSGAQERIEEVLELSAAPGTLRAAWRFEDGRVCGAHGVDSIRVAIFDESDSFVNESTLSCDVGEARLAELPAGTYTVWAVAEGHSGEFSGVTTASIERADASMAELMLSLMP